MTGCGDSDPCAPGPGNAPITDAAYQASLGVSLQSTIDDARRTLHELGLRPYRVFLTWARRNHRQVFEVIRRIELVPVAVSAVDAVDWDIEASGGIPSGTLELSEISPAQVTEHDLRGLLDGQDPPDGVEAFVELVRLPRCPTDKPIPARFTRSSEPYLDGTRWQWKMRITDQAAARSPDDTDQVITPPPRRKGATLRT